MSQLVWRPIEAPRFDMQGLAQNAAGITNAFDKFGQTLINKENSIRSEATDAAIAEAMALQDPEAVKQRLMQGAGGLGRKVNTRDFMEAMGAHQNQLIERATNQEQLEALQDPEKFGQMYAKLELAAKQAEATGDFAARDQLVSEMAGARNIAEHLRGGVSMGDKDQDQKLQLNEFGEQVRHNKAGEADAAVGRGLQAQGLSMQRAEHALRLRSLNRAEQEREGAERAYRGGTAFGLHSDPSLSPEDVVTRLRKTDNWTSATPAVRKVMEESAAAGFASRTGATEGDLLAEGRQADGMPGFMLPRGGGNDRPTSFNALMTGASSAKNQAKVANTAMTQSFMSENPYLQVFQNTQSKKEQSSFGDVVRYFEENTGIHAPAEDIRRIQKRENLTNNEVMALAETFGFQDKPWHTGVDSFTSGTRDFESRAAEYRKARDTGDVDKTAVALGQQTAPLVQIQTQLDRALSKAQRQAGANSGKIPASTAREVQELQQELRRLSTVPR